MRANGIAHILDQIVSIYQRPVQELDDVLRRVFQPIVLGGHPAGPAEADKSVDGARIPGDPKSAAIDRIIHNRKVRRGGAAPYWDQVVCADLEIRIFDDVVCPLDIDVPAAFKREVVAIERDVVAGHEDGMAGCVDRDPRHGERQGVFESGAAGDADGVIDARDLPRRTNGITAQQAWQLRGTGGRIDGTIIVAGRDRRVDREAR